ncbi:hypothetical protein DFJ73DRAFT_921888 [Zopfochytrium polystomum]|nr:hypothetical protein DFJ73DRAFT_921888 [Zopfochytrium polystomum]
MSQLSVTAFFKRRRRGLQSPTPPTLPTPTTTTSLLPTTTTTAAPARPTWPSRDCSLSNDPAELKKLSADAFIQAEKVPALPRKQKSSLKVPSFKTPPAVSSTHSSSNVFTPPVVIPQKIHLLRFLLKPSSDLARHHLLLAEEGRDPTAKTTRPDANPVSTPHKRRKTFAADDLERLEAESDTGADEALNATPVPHPQHVSILVNDQDDAGGGDNVDADKTPSARNKRPRSASPYPQRLRGGPPAPLADRIRTLRAEIDALVDVTIVLRQWLQFAEFREKGHKWKVHGVDTLDATIAKIEKECVKFGESFHKYYVSRGDVAGKADGGAGGVTDYEMALSEIDHLQALHLKLMVQDCLYAYCALSTELKGVFHT